MYKGCDTKTSNIWFYFTFPHPRVKWILMCLKEIRKLINLNHLKLEKKTMQICALYCFEAYIYLAFSVYKLRTESTFTAHLSIKYKCSVFLFFSQRLTDSRDQWSELENRSSAISLCNSSEGEESLNCYGPMSPTFKVTCKTEGDLQDFFWYLLGLHNHMVSSVNLLTEKVTSTMLRYKI